MKAVQPRDISQFLVGKLGEDGAIYKALEYAGPYIESLDVNDRALFPLQAIDVGGKCGFVNPDEKTLRHVRQLFDNPAGRPAIRALPKRRRLSLRGYRRYRCQPDRACRWRVRRRSATCSRSTPRWELRSTLRRRAEVRAEG